MQALNEIYTKEELMEIRKNELSEYTAELQILKDRYKTAKSRVQKKHLRQVINEVKDSIQVIKWQIRDGI